MGARRLAPEEQHVTEWAMGEWRVTSFELRVSGLGRAVCGHAGGLRAFPFITIVGFVCRAGFVANLFSCPGRSSRVGLNHLNLSQEEL